MKMNNNKMQEYSRSTKVQRKDDLWRRRLSLAAIALAGAALASGCSHHEQYAETSYSQTPAQTANVGGSEQQEQSAAMTTSSSSQQAGANVSAQGGNVVIPLYKESANVGKKEVDAGEVRLKKVVKTETVNQPVELRHEEVVISREQNAGQSPNASAMAQPFQEQEYVVHLKREEPVVQKETTQAGAVVVQTRSSTQQQNVAVQTRHDDIDVAKSGDTGNVTIGQNVGGAESPAGQSTGAAGNTPITDANALNAQYAGRNVELSGLKVMEVIDDRLLVLGTSSGQTIYAVSDQQTNAKKGDTVDLNGVVQAKKTAGSDSETGLSRVGTQALISQPYYIEASKITAASQ